MAFFSEMIEHVGHEYMDEFFGCCESLLAEDGLFVLQVIIQMVSYISLSQFYYNVLVFNYTLVIYTLHTFISSRAMYTIFIDIHI